MSLEEKIPKWIQHKKENSKAKPLEFYTLHYSGTLRQELLNLDLELYIALLNDDDIKKIPRYRVKKRKKETLFYGSIEEFIEETPYLKTTETPNGKRRYFGKNPIQFYMEHYEGLTKFELAKEDIALYKRLTRDGWINKLPLTRKDKF